MRYRTLFPRDVFAALERMQHEMQPPFEWSPSIRGGSGDRFPAMNVGGTPQSVEIYAFAPGVDAATLDVQIEKGVLTIAGERQVETPAEKAAVHIDERFAGRFRRVVTPFDVKGGELGHDRLEQVFVPRVDGRVFPVRHVGGDGDLFRRPVVVFLRAGQGPGPFIGEGLKLVGVARA